eukprot:SAG11_NODE_2692_length_3090_cov_2.761618_2_plen_178_part_00
MQSIGSRQQRRLRATCAALLGSGGSPVAATGIDRFSCAGKVALITAGAGDLFGSSVTEALAEAGAIVLTASRSLERNQAFAAKIRRKFGCDARGYKVDISDAGSIAALKDAIMADYGRLDILVNNALTRDGHSRDSKLSATQEAEQLEKVAAVRSLRSAQRLGGSSSGPGSAAAALD